ncbi:MAG: neutral/alkaline non-lysosomal ceramidase N-terminal domain-containing protein [Rhodothermales bacterium]
MLHLRLFMLAACISGCTQIISLPTYNAEPPTEKKMGLYAGFGRADITPPPGFSLAGYGPEAQISKGYRHRLQARTIILQDTDGEKLALVVLDLPMTSAIIHREVSALAHKLDPDLGTDRILISATHTHAGPSHFFDTSMYNAFGGVMPGYDRDYVRFLINQVFNTIKEANTHLQPAKAGWDTLHVKGVTRNRSIEAFNNNQPESGTPLHSVDPTLLMLRVDTCNDDRTQCKPKGAFSTFAIHGTGYPAANALYDGDIHAVVANAMERHIEDLNPALDDKFASNAFYLFANSAQGDVSPSHKKGTRCEDWLTMKEGAHGFTSYVPSMPEEWLYDKEELQRCLKRAEESVSDLGQQITQAATKLFEQIDANNLTKADINLNRSFQVIDWKNMTHDACHAPRNGHSQFAGATEDGRTRFYRWKIFNFLNPGFEEGGKAVKNSSGCHTPKRIFLGNAGQRAFLTGRYKAPYYSQLSLVGIGNTYLATLPLEITTTAGYRIQKVLQKSRGDYKFHGVIGLTNGYMSYLTTEEEYNMQHYEGGSTLYGAQELNVFMQAFDRMVTEEDLNRPIVSNEILKLNPGKSKTILHKKSSGPSNAQVKRHILSAHCKSGSLSFKWLDAHPRKVFPTDDQILEIHKEEQGIWTRQVRDNQHDVTVLPVKGDKKGYIWEVHWSPVSQLQGQYRIVLKGRGSAHDSPSEMIGTLNNGGVVACG